MRIFTIALLIFIFSFSLSSAVFATNFSSQDMQCPVCGTKVQAKSLMSTNSFGGHDRDFLSYATGDQPVLILPVSCVKCYYSGFESDFGTIEAKTLSKLKDEILNKKGINPPETILYDMKSDTAAVKAIPAFIKYDMIAQTYKLLDKGTSEIFAQYISAAWAVRLERELYFDMMGSEAQRTMEWMRKNIDMSSIDTSENNNAAAELATGRLLMQRAQGLAGEDLLYCSLGALFLLRSHGENREAEKVLELVRPSLSGERYELMEKKIRESIALERKYQRMAADFLEADLVSGAIKGESQQAQMYYMAGELNRRCLDFEKARKHFEEAIKLGKLTPPIDKYVKEQLELCK